MRRAFDRDEILRWLGKALHADTDSCIIWPFRVQVKGYGVFWDGEVYHLAHRFICRAWYGPSGDDDAAHACGNRLCCNRRHLSWKSHAENLEDRRGHGTLPMGTKAYQAVLTEDQVIAIRAARRTQRELADQYGVSPGTIQAIREGRSWKHLMQSP